MDVAATVARLADITQRPRNVADITQRPKSAVGIESQVSSQRESFKSSSERRKGPKRMSSVMAQQSYLERMAMACEHENVTDGFCAHCGMSCSHIFDESQVYTHNSAVDKSLMKDLDTLPFEEEIKRKADEIYASRLHRITKKGEQKRKQLVWFCLDCAYKELGIPIDPNIIATKVGLPPNEMNKALSAFSEAKTGYRPPQEFTTPIHLLPGYASQLNFADEMVDDVVTFASGILVKDPELVESKPQKVAAGILLYYCNIHGVELNKREYAKMIGLSEVTIVNTAKHVAMLDNTVTRKK